MPVRDILHKAVEAAYAEVTANAARALLLNRRGQLYRSFPSRRVLEWALEAARRRGLPEQGRWDPPLLYACMRRVYKSLEFDVGWNPNLGWAYTTHLDLYFALASLVRKSTGIIQLEGEDRRLFDESLEAIIDHCESVGEELRRELTGGVSYGAQVWWEAMGRPRELVEVEVHGDRLYVVRRVAIEGV